MQASVRIRDTKSIGNRFGVERKRRGARRRLREFVQTFVKRRRTEIASRVAAAEEFRGHCRRQAVARQRGLEGCYSGQRSARRQLCKGGIAAPPLSNTQTPQRGREPNAYLFVICLCGAVFPIFPLKSLVYSSW